MSNQLPDADAIGLQFLRTELVTGMTFCKIAAESKYELKAERNRANARRAYNAILHFTPGTSLSAEESREIGRRMAQLKFALQELGEDV